MTWLRRFARWLAEPDAGAILSAEVVREFSLLKEAVQDTRQELAAVRQMLRALDQKLSDLRRPSSCLTM
jgi:phage shock protein A